MRALVVRIAVVELGLLQIGMLKNAALSVPCNEQRDKVPASRAILFAPSVMAISVGT